MCTLQQKAALLDFALLTESMVKKRLRLPSNRDQRYLARLSLYISRTPCEQLNYPNLVQQIQEIKLKYHHLPETSDI